MIMVYFLYDYGLFLAIPERLVMVSDPQSLYSDYYQLEWHFTSFSDPIECFLDVTQVKILSQKYMSIILY